MLLSLSLSLFLFVISAFYLCWPHPFLSLSPCDGKMCLSSHPYSSATRNVKKFCPINFRWNNFRRDLFAFPDHHLSSWLPQCLRTEGHYNWWSPGLLISHQAEGLGYVTRKKKKKSWSEKDNSHYRDKSPPSTFY